MADISAPQSCGQNRLDGGVGRGQLLEEAWIGSVWLEGRKGRGRRKGLSLLMAVVKLHFRLCRHGKITLGSLSYRFPQL